LKILILKPSSLGDVIQALPVLRLLKLHFRDAEIHWWIDSSLAPLIEGDPDLAGIVRFERKRWSSPAHWPEMLRSVRWLRAQRFDWIIDLQGLLRSSVFGWLSRGRFFVGLENRNRGSREGAHLFYDEAVRLPVPLHAVTRYLSILPVLGVPLDAAFQWLPERPEVAAAVKAKWPELKTASRWIAIQPGARWDTKRWPVEHFTKLAGLLAQKHPGVRFAVFGSADERQFGEIISSAAPERILNLCGRTPLPEMIEWLRLCELMITNDTGPMHVAAALGVPVVALFGPTDPRSTGPYGQLENVIRMGLPCSPCFNSSCQWTNPVECLTALSPERVFDFVEKKLKN
jgi:lipopolysaccharide heptosyltransferase I